MTTTREVKLGDLRLEHKYFANPRVASGLDDPSILALGEDIKKNGLIELPKVQKVKYGGTVLDLLWDGQRRVKGMLKVWGPDKVIEVIDRTEDPIEMTQEIGDDLTLDALRTTNRTELSSAELAGVAEKLRSHGKTNAAIGLAIGRDASWVSKILAAVEATNPKVRAAWESGDIPDEMFKDLSKLSHKDQSFALDSALHAREEGDEGEARTRVKELREQAKKAATQFNDEAKKPKTEAKDAKAEPKPVKPKRDTPARAMLEDFVKLADEHPPTTDYARGVIDALRFVTGDLDQGDFAKPWHVYVARANGTPLAKKSKAKKAKAKARRKPAKKKSKR